MQDTHETPPASASQAPTAPDRTPATVPAAQPAAAQGALVMDRYRMLRPIGRGGHGTVWEAVDERLERRVAVKLIPHREGEASVRAEREGRVAARLVHPGIVTLYEVGSDAQAVYLVSELVHGRTMAELAAGGALSDRDVCDVGLAVCRALAHAHDKGVVHRDVKPQNVIVVAEPAAGAGFAKLTDFGVAHVAGDETLTRTGDVVGTFAYMAPEQAGGEHASPAADTYSLALVLYEGWAGSGPRELVAERLQGRPIPPLRRSRPDLPPRLCAAIDAALDPRPELRPDLPELERELAAAAAALSHEGGLEEPATRTRFGIPSAPRAVPAPPGWLLRAGAAVAAGALVAVALELLAKAPVDPSPLAAGAVAAAGVALLPRVAWLLAAVGILAWLAWPGGGNQGTALVVAAALAPVPMLLPRAGLLWSVPALAPLLGAAGLAPAFVALAGLGRTAWRRAGLALAGFLWLAATELLTGETLLYGPADGTSPAATWEGSALDAARDAIYPTLTSPALVPAMAWAALALALGLVVRGRSPALDVIGATGWAIAAVAAHAWLGDLVGTGAAAEPGAAAAGAALGALAAVSVGFLRWRRRQGDEASFP